MNYPLAVKLLLGTLFGAALIAVCVGCYTRTLPTDVLMVGCETAFPPFELLNEHGELVGFDCDVIKAVAKKLGRQIEFKIMSFENLILSLKQKKIDLAISAISINEQRGKEVNFVHYHGTEMTQLPLVFWQKAPNITHIEELNADLAGNQGNGLGKGSCPVISVQSGSVQKDWIAAFHFITVHQLDTIPELVLEIKYGKALACVLEPGVLEHLKKQYPELQVRYVPLSDAYKTYGHGIAIAKDNNKLTVEVQKAIDELKSDGTLLSLEKKWFTHGFPSS